MVRPRRHRRSAPTRPPAADRSPTSRRVPAGDRAPRARSRGRPSRARPLDGASDPVRCPRPSSDRRRCAAAGARSRTLPDPGRSGRAGDRAAARLPHPRALASERGAPRRRRGADGGERSHRSPRPRPGRGAQRLRFSRPAVPAGSGCGHGIPHRDRRALRRRAGAASGQTRSQDCPARSRPGPARRQSEPDAGARG